MLRFLVATNAMKPSQVSEETAAVYHDDDRQAEYQSAEMLSFLLLVAQPVCPRPLQVKLVMSSGV